MNWEKVLLQDVAHYWTGKTEVDVLDENCYVSTENLLVDKGGLVKSSYLPTSGRSNSYAEGDVLVSNIRPYFKKIWYAENDGGCSNDVLVFRANDNIDSHFLYYLLSKDAFFDYMVAGSNGTKMPRGNRKSIMNYKLTLPPLSIQRRIASILSAYDDLIENNLRRVKLLEEKAEMRYREILNGEKLKVVCLKDVAVVNQKSLKKESSLESLLYVDIASVSTGSIDKKQEYELEDAPGRAKRILRNQDIIWSCVRPNKMSYSFVWKPEENLIASTGFAVISATKIPSTFLYQLLTTSAFVKYLENHAKGATYPAVTSTDFENAMLQICSNEVMEEYHSEAIHLFALKDILQKQNTKLREARDILLPRLMGGEIEV